MPFKQTKKNVSEIMEGEPGNRFTSLYERRRQTRSRHPVRDWLLIGLGCLLVIGGMLLSIPPGMPGFLVTFTGLGMIVARSLWAARILDRSEEILWSLWGRIRAGDGKEAE